MRLADLEPMFLKLSDDRSFRTDAALADCDGILFLCPKCFQENNGPIGTHSIICWQPHVPLTDYLTGPGRWKLKGTSIDDLTFVAGSSSVLLTAGCQAHFFVRDGQIAMC